MNDKLFDCNIDLVKQIVNKMNYGYIDKDDLLQAGLIGLFKATKKYNKEINNNFKSFASVYIISEIKNELRNNKLIILNKDIIKTKKYLQSNFTSLTLSQISELLNVSLDTVHFALIYQNDICSLNEIKENHELIDDISDINESLFKNYYYNFDYLDVISKKVIILKYYKNYSQKEISKILNCSQSKISRIEKRALEIIKKQSK